MTIDQRSNKSNKKNILKSFSNFKIRKILKAFKTLSTLVIKIEANILLTRSRLNKKIRDYVIKKL